MRLQTHRGPTVAGLVSVVVPVHDCERRYLEACLQSIRNQDWKGDVELIVVNDGSDPRYEVEETARASDVDHLIVLPSNQGACAARNVGWLSGRGEFTLFFDADDVLRSDALSTMTATLEGHPEASLCFSDFEVDGRRFEAGPFELPSLLRKNRVAIASLVRTKAFVGFDPGVPRGMDWDAWLRMRRRHPDLNLPGRKRTLPRQPASRRSTRAPRRVLRRKGRAAKPPATVDRTIVTAVVVFHNSQPWLEVTLRSLLKHRFTRDHERVHLRVLLIENPCNDESPRIAREFQREFGDNAAVIRSGLRVDRVGGGENHAHGLAAGFRHVKPDSEWVLFLDADVVLLRHDWLDALLATGGDVVGPPAFAYLKDYSVPHAHPSFLLFRSKLGRPPYWNGDFRHRLHPPDGSEYWDTAIPFTMAMGRRDDVKLVQLPQTRCTSGALEYFHIFDLALHVRGVSNLAKRPERYSAKADLLRLPEVAAVLDCPL